MVAESQEAKQQSFNSWAYKKENTVKIIEGKGIGTLLELH